MSRSRRRKRSRGRYRTERFIGFTPDGKARLIKKKVEDEEAEDPRAYVAEALTYEPDPDE